MKTSRLWLSLMVLMIGGGLAWADSVHYERPVSAAPQAQDIGGGYTVPPVQRALPHGTGRALVDMGLLAGALAAAGYIVLARRSRSWSVGLSIAALAYFGFYRQGCICPIGAIQNIAAALRDPSYVVPVVAVVFFCLPLLVALLFGRLFCGGACPLGAIQELVLLKPVIVPGRLDRILGKFRYAYLLAAIWFTMKPAAARDFIICRFDPFVGFFRFNGPGYMLIAGGVLLVIGLFIGRPYCRYLCPYGALLSIVSRFAWKGVSITPDDELDCGLCTGSCPYGAIEKMRAVRASCLACARCYRACPRERVQEGAA